MRKGTTDMDILSGLNDMQQEAVKTVSGPLLILAGAGSGKTRTVIHRIAYLMTECGVAPWRILALTFTNKAAGEMRERIDAFGIENTNEIWMGTFHSVFARILRRHAEYIGFTSDYSIYDETDKKNLIKEVMASLSMNEKVISPDAVMNLISDAKNNAVFTSDYEKEYGFYTFKRDIAKAYDVYQKKLAENNAMDFDDLLLNAYRLFTENPSVAESYQDRFLHVLIDEYQDTNRLQYEIVSIIAKGHNNICVVGDDDQSIYGWRGADIRNILEFEEDFPDAKVIRLEQNYRSTSNILDAANAVISNNKNRKGKELWTALGSGEKVHILRNNRDIDEGDDIASIIKELVSKGAGYSDFAVLYRINSQSRVLEESLLRASVPYQIVRGTRFYERREIKDIMAYLKLAVNPRDEIAFERALVSPRRGIGPSTMDKLADYAAFKGISRLEACSRAMSVPTLSGAVQAKLSEFAHIVESIAVTAASDGLEAAVKYAINESGYKEALMKRTDDPEGRVRNLDEFVSAAADFEASSEDSSLSAFLENAALIAGADTISDNDGQVLLMSIHNSKGLEFNTVFVAGMEEGLFPLSRALEEESELEEERRLCYVAMTRAERRLYLSYAETRRQYGATRSSEPSRFISEVPEEYTDEARPLRTRRPGSSGNRAQFTSSFGTADYKMAARPDEKKNTSGKEQTYSPGDKIIHSTWGAGTVVDVGTIGGDVLITAAFAGLGIKKFIPDASRVKKAK